MSKQQQRPRKTIAVTGPPGGGKATLIGNLMYKCGGIDMLRLDELGKAGINSYDRVIRYYNEHSLELCFETRHATIVVQGREMGGVVDCLVYVDFAGAAPSSIQTLVENYHSKHIIYVVNKLDCVDWSEEMYTHTIEAMRSRLGEQGLSISTIPISALHGDNILELSTNTPWFATTSSSRAALVDVIDRAVMS